MNRQTADVRERADPPVPPTQGVADPGHGDASSAGVDAGAAQRTGVGAAAHPDSSPGWLAGRRRRRRRSRLVHLCLTVVLVAAGLYSISVGDFPIPIGDIVRTLIEGFADWMDPVPGLNQATDWLVDLVGRGSEDAQFIIRTLRLPRALTGILVGAAFGVSGCLFQTMSRNPLASPDIIGVTAGASASAVFIIVVLHGGTTMVSGGALLGAIIIALLIYVLAWRRGVSPYRFVLVGIGIAAVAQAITQYLLTRAELYDAQQAVVWLTGSLNGRGWEHVWPVSIALALLLPAVIGLSRPLSSMQFGDDVAKGLGVRIEGARLCLVVVAVLLAAIATASSGPIAFVAFMSAPIANRLTRRSVSVLGSALVGALIVVVGDLIARRLFAPTQLPVGVVTGAIGGPYLLWLLARFNRVTQ